MKAILTSKRGADGTLQSQFMLFCVITSHYIMTLRYDVMDLLWCWQLSVVLGSISDYLKAVSHTVSRVQAIDHHIMFEMLHPVSCVWLSPIFIDIISHQSELGQAVWAGLMKSDINWISNPFFVASQRASALGRLRQEWWELLLSSI